MSRGLEDIESEKEELIKIYNSNSHKLNDSSLLDQSRRVDKLIVSHLKKQLRREREN